MMMSTATRGRWADLDIESDSDLNDSISDYSWFTSSGSAATTTETGFKKQAILRAVHKAMTNSPNHDALSEDDTSVGSPRSETSFKKQTILHTVHKPMSDTSDDDASHGSRSANSTLVRSDIGKFSSTSSSKRCLRNIPLTREHLLELQQRSAFAEDARTVNESSLVWEEDLSSERNAAVSTKADMNMVQEDLSVITFENIESASLGEPVSQWTVGSNAHESGGCKPCLFYISSTGCLSGPDCRFCHLSHSRANFPRPSKSKRDRIKKMLSSQGGH